LNGILGYADLLAHDKRLDEAQRKRADRIQAAVRHLAIMIEQILGLAGLDEEPESSTPTTLDACAAVRAAAEMCEPVATAAGLTLRLELPVHPLELTTDHNRLRMILINLLGNAIKFTEQGEIRIEVRAETNRVAFEVQDAGIGIAPENHELVFERFFQVSKGLTRSAGGVGIGLSAAREFSRQLGGDIEVRSDLGSGSAFTLWLPLTPPAVKPPPPRRRPTAARKPKVRSPA
jgi:signal transduction histidine kinase